eukprot:TRINITY_DN18599_c0_g1_i1.p3 TRINITY_DN18599_c0_g1~~TRINITY_DN18599_c0_g1_i1.p3  ORF type:complete len:215 (+),score=39.79 TRINITY_DN18599_c0_g1_i1:776-1420(+)
MVLLMERRRFLRDRAIRAEGELDELLAQPTRPRNPDAVAKVLESARRADVPEAVCVRFQAELAKESLEAAIREGTCDKLEAALEIAGKLDLEWDSLFMEATRLRNRILNAPMVLLEAQRERVEGEQTRQKQKQEALALQQAKRQAREEARKAKKQEKLRKLEETRTKEQGKCQARNLERPLPQYPTSDWLNGSLSNGTLPAPKVRVSCEHGMAF